MTTRQKLERYLEDCLEREFAFGQFDCGLFVGEWSDRLTGSQLVRKVKGKYNCIPSSARIAGRNPFAFAVEELRGAGFIDSQRPRVGDIAVVHGGGLGILHVVGETFSVVVPSESRGLVYMPMCCVMKVLTCDLQWTG